MTMMRIRSGINGFDELLNGGFPDKSINLVTGSPGTGKTVFCLQFLIEGAKKKEKSMFISFEEKEKRIKRICKNFGFPVEKLEKQGYIKIVSIDLKKERKKFNEILEVIKTEKYKRLAIDSLSDLSVFPFLMKGSDVPVTEIEEKVFPMQLMPETIVRMKIMEIIDLLRQTNATILLTSETFKESKSYSRDTVSEFLCDSIILLNYVEIGVTDYRTMSIIKMRETNHYKDLIPFDITKKGIKLRLKEIRKR